MTVEGTFIDNSMLKCKVPVLDQHGVTSSGSSTETATNPRNQSLGDSDALTFNTSNPVVQLSDDKSPPDPDNTFKFMVSCDGQHFDSVPDNIVFTFRDPAKVVVVWIWLGCILGAAGLAAISCAILCCCGAFSCIKSAFKKIQVRRRERKREKEKLLNANKYSPEQSTFCT